LNKTIFKQNSLFQNVSCQVNPTPQSTDEIYKLYSKFDKEFRNIADLKTIEEKFPFKCKEDETERYSKMMQSLYSIHEEYKNKPKKQKKSSNALGFVKMLMKQKTKDINDETKDPELTNQTPEFRMKRILSKLEKHTKYDFAEVKEYSFNASLIVRNKISGGVVILGSNNYKYKAVNLEELDTIINIIGEYPSKEFEKEKSLHIEEFKEKFCKEVFETTIVTKTGHCVNCYTKPNENFSSYHYLADVIHKHMWSGNRVLVHCQMGQVRSATLMLFYLRKYFFDNVNDGNEYIGLKREKAGAPTMLFNNIENLIKEKK